MDTPERAQIGTSVSKFEDSPVFNYISSLSPIKPVKSIHTSHTFSSLNFSSPPSVFTSPHVTSLKGSTFLRRHSFSNPSNPEFSSHDGTNKHDKPQETIDTADLCDDLASFKPPNERLDLANNFPQALNYDCGSSYCDSTPYCGSEDISILELSGPSTVHVPYSEKIDERERDWRSLISEATTELFNFDSPNGTNTFEHMIHKSHEQMEAIFCSNASQSQEEDGNDLHKAQSAGQIEICEQFKIDDPSTQPEVVRDLKDINQMLGEQASTSMSKCMESQPIEIIDNEPESNLHRGIRRRCLVFEINGARRKNLNTNSSSHSSSMLLQSNEDLASIDKKLVPIKATTEGDSSRPILPGIGLHLNAIALTPKDLEVVKHESLFHSPKTGEESNYKLVKTSNSVERDTKPLVEDASQECIDIAGEDINQSSSKKKRRRDEGGENEACKRCNCKKSKCLKLYCECFAAGVYCIEPCSCRDCFNKPIHEDTVLATRKQIETRNPLAFAPKVIQTSDSIPEIGDESNQTPASARHKRGCNCKKSGCLKKYCECYQGGVGCSINCRCEGCKNAFGKKDETEVEPDEEETKKLEKIEMNKSGLQKCLILNNEEQNADSTPLLATPSHLSRLSIKLPFSSKSKMLQRSFTIGSSSGLQTCSKLARPNFLPPQQKPKENFQNILEGHDIPEILRTINNPSSGIKKASPNSKRVSPPHCEFGTSSSSSPDRRSSRKLILQSIPSFPCLNPQP